MRHKDSKKRFWSTLAIVNISVIAYPAALCLQAGKNDELFAPLLLVGIAFLLAIADAISALAAYVE